MKNIEIDDELYLHIVSNTQSIGESASSILRRLMNLTDSTSQAVSAIEDPASVKTSPLEAITAETPVVIDTDEENQNDNNSESVFNFINKEELAMQRGAVGRFLLILAALHRAHAKQFNVVTEICGRDRLYFAHTKAELEASGSSTKPKQIPDSPFWVMTNSNTTRKKMMLTKAAQSLGYSENDAEKIRELL